MLDTIKKMLWKPEGQEKLRTPPNTEIVFKLFFNELEIGTLHLKAGIWTFTYSDNFKAQDYIKPLLNFPQVDKVYTSEELYPFFVERIPGLGQTKVQEIIRKEKIDEHNEAVLLKRFGRLTIANPFELRAV
jgi:HipA-like protein